MRKLYSYLSAFIVSAYVVYLDYSMLHFLSQKFVKILHIEADLYSVYAFVRYLFYLTGSFVIFIYLSYFIFYLYFKGNEGATTHYPSFYPKVSIVIPAYNEGMTIEKALESIFYQDYPRECYEVIVIDDGSQDKTSEIVSGYDIKLIRHENNMGKVKSLEDGIKAAKGDVILTMDADSYFMDGSSLKRIVQGLYSKPLIGVSTGVIRIATKKGKLIEKLQELEFLHSFEVGRRIQGYLDWLLVIPGAFSAFKAYVLKPLDALPKDTLAEDFDLAMIIYRAGLTSHFEPSARIYTDSKVQLRDLYRQRIRWFYGGLQVLRKHYDMILNPKYKDRGLFLFVHMIILEYVLPFIQIFGIVAFPLIIILQYYFGMQITDINLPPMTVVLLTIFVIFLQYIPGVLTTLIIIASEYNVKRAIQYFPAVWIYYVVYNPFLSLAKIDATLRYLRGVVERW